MAQDPEPHMGRARVHAAVGLNVGRRQTLTLLMAWNNAAKFVT